MVACTSFNRSPVARRNIEMKQLKTRRRICPVFRTSRSFRRHLQDSVISDAARMCGYALSLAEGRKFAVFLKRSGHTLGTIGIKNFQWTV